MSDLELQDEEREVLLSIYDGDTNFKQLSPTVYQYKYGEDNTAKSLILEVKWGETYPTEKPELNMDLFYNKHILSSIKQKVIELVSNEAEQYLGMSMTYTLFECLKEKYEELIKDQPEQLIEGDGIEKLCISETQEEVSKKAPKKEQMTKAQKRRQWNRMDGTGERPRGWDWVDIVKHLSQTGSKEDSASAT